MERMKARWRRAAATRSMEIRILLAPSAGESGAAVALLLLPLFLLWQPEKLLEADELVDEEAAKIFRSDISLIGVNS